MNKIFKGLLPNHFLKEILPSDFLNSYLVINKVRPAFLIQNFEDNDLNVLTRISKIQNIFPNLLLLKSGNYYFLSIKKLNCNDVNTEKKIAEILRYNTDVDFDKLDRETEIFTFNFIFDIKNIESINLITYICQTDSKKKEAELFLKDIKKAISQDNILKEKIRISLKINRVIPPKSLIPKLLIKNYILNKDEIEAINNIIFNTMNPSSIDKIIKALDYNNPVHRGIILSFIASHEFDTLKPFYPIQNSGYFEEINEIDEQKSILLEKILLYK